MGGGDLVSGEQPAGQERHVAVIGGGITGLSAAHALLGGDRAGGRRLRVTVIEADRRLGGKVRTEEIAGESVDVGAESLMVRGPAVRALCQELELDGELVAPTRTTTCLWTRGRTRELPAGVLGGMPQGVWPLLRSGIVSPAGLGRAALDLVLPASVSDGDRSVAEVMGARFGREAVEQLVDPLLGTIYATGCDSLSARAILPHVDLAAREHRSLLRGLRAAGKPGGAGGPQTASKPPAAAAKGPAPPSFLTLPGGLERIVARLRHSLAGEDLRCGVHAGPLLRSVDGRYRLHVSHAEPLQLDGVVIATPAPQAAAVLGAICPHAARRLRAIGYSSTVVVTLRFRGDALARPPAFVGLLVPRSERRLLGALTVLSAKWEHLAANGELWLRASVSRDAVASALQLEDGELVRRIIAELREAIGLKGAPLDAHVTRWRACLPVYAPGHQERIDAVEQALCDLPGVAVAGAAYRGVGVPQCIEQGRQAAKRVLHSLVTPSSHLMQPTTKGGTR